MNTILVKTPNIKKLRELLGLDEYDFALCFGVSPHEVIDWEAGVHAPNLPMRVLADVILKSPHQVKGAVACLCQDGNFNPVEFEGALSSTLLSAMDAPRFAQLTEIGSTAAAQASVAGSAASDVVAISLATV